MAEPDRDEPDRPRRRGLLVPSIQRTPATRYANRAVRVAQATARRALGVLLALVIVFEEWGWKPLAAALGLLARFRPIAWVEQRIAELPPWASLCVFAEPTALFLPLKLAALGIRSGFIAHTT